MRRIGWRCGVLLLAAASGFGGGIARAQAVQAASTQAVQAQQVPAQQVPAQAAPAQAGMMSRKEVTGVLADSRKVVSPNGVEELLTIPVNGTKQWLSIRGRDGRNPILLVLHGGPGSPTMPAAYAFQSPWEDFLTVVKWDQRGAGKTYASNDSKALAGTMTVEQMTSDAEEVIRSLQATYGKKKIFLLGHSWGSVLGVEVAQRHPEWLYAYLGVGQMVNMQKSEKIGFDFALEQARARHNGAAEKELLAIAPYPGSAGGMTFEKIGAQRKWVMYYGGLTYGRTDFSYDANAWQLSPDYTEKDLDSVDDGSLYSVTQLLGQLMAMNFNSVTNFKCPVFLFDGRHDYATSHELVVEWFKKIQAPEKEFVWFDNSSHMVMQEEPGRFLHYLVQDVRPLAEAAGDTSADNEVLR